MAAFTEVICSLPLYPSTGGLGAADWWCLSFSPGIYPEWFLLLWLQGFIPRLWRIPWSPGLPVRRNQEWPWTPSMASHCLKDNFMPHQCDPILGARGGGWIRVCVCVRLWQGIAYFSYPTLTHPCDWELSSRTPSTISSCCFLLFWFILASWSVKAKFTRK